MSDHTSGVPPRPGDTVGRYRIEHVVGTGAMGMVFAARDLRLERRVALKLLLAGGADSDSFRRRFERESAVLARLDAPHVIAIFDHGEHHGHPYIVTQYAAGGDLAGRLRERGPMPAHLALGVCAQVADALVASHGVGVIHRDVKPANILLRDDRLDRLHIYLGDFGVALTESQGLTTPGAVAGTWSYLAPERISGDPGSAASDLYSVGCVLFELLTGAAPYSGSDVEVAMKHASDPVPQLAGSDPVTAHLNGVLDLTLTKSPEHRYPSAVDLRDALRELAGSLTPAPVAGAVPPAAPGALGLPGSPGSPGAPGSDEPRRARRSRLLMAGLAVAAVAAIGAGTAAAVLTDDGGVDPGASAVTPGAVPETTAPNGDPTASTGSTTGAIPSAPGAVTGDVDDDGLGDLLFADFGDSYLQLSQGGGFGPLESRGVTGGFLSVTGDITGDGVLDVVRVDGEETSSQSITVVAAGLRTTTRTFTMPANRTETDRDLICADVDGDGYDDLVVATPQPDGGVELTVARNRGDGSFEESSRWWRGDLRALDAGWAVADFDLDGDDDLVHHTEPSAPDYKQRATMLESDGAAFAISGERLRIPDRVGDSFYSFDTLAAGDVDGDGTPELVAFNPYGLDAVIWRWAAVGFRAQSLWTPEGPPDKGGGNIYGGLSDVDGDGRDDIVTVGSESIKVHLSTGTSFRYAPSWTRRQKLQGGGNMIGPVALGIY